MASLISIARPYARATFNFAREENELLAWKTFLALAEQTVTAPKVLAFLNNPEITSKQSFALFNTILSSIISDKQKNFLNLLAQNKRLSLLPIINELFNAYYATYQKVSAVRLVTAVEVSQDYKQKLAQALKNKLAHDVILQCEIDPALLGGAIIQFGDRIIDGSIRGKLHRLLNNITS